MAVGLSILLPNSLENGNKHLGNSGKQTVSEPNTSIVRPVFRLSAALIISVVVPRPLPELEVPLFLKSRRFCHVIPRTISTCTRKMKDIVTRSAGENRSRSTRRPRKEWRTTGEWPGEASDSIGLANIPEDVVRHYQY